jgi:hypothetical protein
MPFDVLTREEAALKARISQRSLDRHIANGSGPAVTRIGRRVLVQSDSFREVSVSSPPLLTG